MSDMRKFHVWIQGMLHWREKAPQQVAKKTDRRKRSRDRHYVGESYPGVYLTAREFEVATLLVKNYRYKEIAEVLSLSHRSVEFYVQHIRDKFQCANKKALVALLAKIDLPTE